MNQRAFTQDSADLKKFNSVFGLKAWKWRPSSYTSLKQKLKSSKHHYFNYCTEGDIEELWKEHIKTRQRKVKRQEGTIQSLIDIGIVVLKEEEEKNPAASCSGSKRPPTLITTSTTSKKKTTKKATIIYQPPDIIACNIMQPIRLSNKENTAVSLNTNVIKTLRIDCTKYLEDNMRIDGNDDDSTECIAELGFKKNIIVSFRKELARAILDYPQTKKVNTHCLYYIIYQMFFNITSVVILRYMMVI